MTDFEKATHNAEIEATRVGGLGGSDASLILAVGLKGLSGLTATYLKRLAVMTGQIPYETFAGNVYTMAGHFFEDYASKILSTANREYLLTADLAKTFKTFAHADFEEDGTIYECKFVGERDSSIVARKYYAQLQYYYLLGAKAVKLVHGTGAVDPFSVENIEIVPIERDEETIETLKNGLRLLDEFIPSFVYAEDIIEGASEELSEIIAELISASENVAYYERKVKEARAVIENYMVDADVAKIDAGSHIITKAKDTISRSFDSTTFLKAHPEFDKAEFYKQTTRKGAFSVKAKKNEG